MRIAHPAPAKKLACLDIKIIRLKVARRRHLQAGHLARRKIGPQRPNDTFGQLGLDREEVGQFAIECLRPDVVVGPRVDELGIDPDAVAGASHRAFEDMGDTERFADLAQVARASAILLHRGATDDFQVGDSGQARKNVVVHAFGKESVLAIVAQIFKRKNGDAFLRHRRRRSDVVGSLDSGGRDVIGPGQNNCDRESEDKARG